MVKSAFSRLVRSQATQENVVPEVAGDSTIRLDLRQNRLLLPAHLLREGTTRMETAAVWRVGWTRYVSTENYPPSLSFGLPDVVAEPTKGGPANRDGGVGSKTNLEKRPQRSFPIHDSDPVGDMTDDSEIVRDERCNNPLVFSLEPRCQGEWGSQK
jgi:hypothetical protein